MADSIENGDIYFFYRPKIDINEPSNLDDIQRFYLVLMPDGGSSKARILVVGKKQMPAVSPGSSSSEEREWMMVSMVDEPDKIGQAMRPVQYQTKTRGTQQDAEAIPVGEGRYSLFEKSDSSRLAYALSSPENPGKAQEIFRIQSEASYIISIRNPDIEVQGFPKEKPEYPKTLQKKFADERWLSIDEPRLLDYENAQLVMIGAHESLDKSAARITGKPDLFGKLGLAKADWPTQSLENGELAKARHNPESREAESDRSKGGEHGGNQATGTASAAGIAQALKGISFPTRNSDLVSYARDHGANKDIVGVLEALPRRRFDTMADVEKAVGEVR